MAPGEIIEAIRSAVNQIDGVDAAYIFGSWAARYSGIDGPPPSDIDVLLIGTVERRAASAVSAELTRRLGQDVNTYRVSTQMWESNLPDAFTEDVRAHPLILLLNDFEVAYRDSEVRRIVDESRASSMRIAWKPGPPN
ncbi:Uncharacterised protein (plasmid) [Tsukamurella tyrosinosolvens]|uniref:Nucleotidyltransferase domain-containing protein n=1 Tax=Tsukamurella tyrosinosolvens TaxID=57704 RepID=A0A1H4WJG9_TSUTY|nr:hypothetical protein [Tsukamurella tyrosinosolvens]KXO99411.1 hypothetical protein AXK58_24100 [Tsukamurella tyrosinosolvens]SEC93446.1 hypothetical protein SAMN04489793_3582 [Tsukamurella tyrosinosolvens]VEH89395.1 Uncharacterised protein [Tsukamurella tyrosinosolvens]